jgi:hypothetical protein
MSDFETLSRQVGEHIAKQRGPHSELEAIAYARGFVRALVYLGKTEQEARDIGFMAQIDDPLLDAGAALMGKAIIESLGAPKQ